MVVAERVRVRGEVVMPEAVVEVPETRVEMAVVPEGTLPMAEAAMPVAEVAAVKTRGERQLRECHIGPVRRHDEQGRRKGEPGDDGVR